MPLTKRVVNHSLDYAEPSLYQGSNDNEVLANVNLAGMTGTMTQLGYLASYATEMLSDLKELADTTHKRVENCTKRTRKLLDDIPKLQQDMADADSSFSQLLQPKQDLQQQEQETKNQLFVAASVPASLDARYKSEDVKPPPNFAEVELAMTDAEKAKHGNCGKVYSDPQFFFSEWEKEEEVRYRKQMEAKAQRKKEKKARKAKEKALKEKERGLAKQKTVTAKKALNWKNRYNLDDVGNMRVEQTISQANNLNLVSTRQLETGNVGLNTVDKESSVAQAMRAGGERGGVGGVGGGGGEGGGVSGVGGGGAATRPPPPPKKAGGGGGGGGQPPPPPKRNVPPPVREEEEEFYAAPSQQSTGGFKPPPPPRREVVQDAPAPAPAPPPKRPMPAKTVMPKSALDMSVLSGISGGGFQLKKAAPIVKKVDPKMNLLASIKKQQGGGLKKVDQEKVKAERRASTKALETGGGGMFGGAGGGINAILERRKFLAEESDDSSSDEDWD